jgi:hypothetical protein
MSAGNTVNERERREKVIAELLLGSTDVFVKYDVERIAKAAYDAGDAEGFRRGIEAAAKSAEAMNGYDVDNYQIAAAIRKLSEQGPHPEIAKKGSRRL